jgi:hypothetical protein
MTTTSMKHTKSLTHCLAIRSSDQMHCGLCGTQWDADDMDRPPCTFQLQEEIKALRYRYDHCDRNQRADFYGDLVKKENELNLLQRNRR